MLTADITRKAKKLYPDSSEFQAVYVKGFLDALDNISGVEEGFFETLASKLREMWPSGDKDGKYSWRDSVPNLAERLRTLWDIRQLKNYTIETCLSVARRYLSSYEDNKKYMQTLKYFILKQDDIIQSNGMIKHINKSKFADMLEGKKEVDAALNEWDDILNNDLFAGEGGMLI